MEASNYRPLNLSDVRQAAQVISRAFEHDPLCVYMLPDKRTRLKTLNKFFFAYGDIFIRNQRGYGVGGPLKGVAFWIEPARLKLTINIKSLVSFLPMLFSVSPVEYFKVGSIIKALTIRKIIENLHRKFAPGPHYYLQNIGVLPAEQGRGYSSRLIRPILTKADAEQVAVYTDTVSRANLGLYQHFGFRCMEVRLISGTGITVWALRRPVQ
jgi:ribosomal protein S18 acetylase RimI-like enzyme